jgi:hypothetical protein
MNDGYIRWSELQSSFNKLNERLDYMEQHLVAMGAAAGYRYAPSTRACLRRSRPSRAAGRCWRR